VEVEGLKEVQKGCMPMQEATAGMAIRLEQEQEPEEPLLSLAADAETGSWRDGGDILRHRFLPSGVEQESSCYPQLLPVWRVVAVKEAWRRQPWRAAFGKLPHR
jgi:hypothetical protein